MIAPPEGMKRMFFVLASLFLFLCTSPIYGQTLRIGEQTGQGFSYDPNTQYAALSLKTLNLPALEDESSPIANFFRKVFLHRKRFGLAYVEVIPPFGEEEKTILFSFEREERARYRYHHIGATDNIVFPISRPFVYGAPVVIKIVIKEWEDEKASAAVKQIIHAIDQSGLAGQAAPALANVTLILGLVEQIFKPDSMEEVMNLKVKSEDIVRRDLQILGDESPFFQISFSTEEAFFNDFDFHSGLLKAGIEGIESWKKMIQTADLNLASDGLDPLVSVVQSFSDFVSGFPLNKRDKAIMTACAMKHWAPNAVSGITGPRGEEIKFTAHHYSRLPTADLQQVRGSACDFSGVDCTTPQCHAMSDFINKCATTSGRRQAAELYLTGEISLDIDGTEKLLSVDEFASKFRIRRPAFFTAESPGPNSWSYHFEPGSLALIYDGTSYEAKRTRIDMIREPAGAGSRYTVTGITIRSN